MLAEFASIIVDGFNQYGLESVGYLIMALCFGMFFIRSTQKQRFHLISTACYILAFGMILLVILPALVILNPNFLISFEGYEIIQGITVSLACSFLGVSLLVSALGMSALLSLAFLFFVIQVIFIHVFRIYFPEYNLIYWSLAVCWVIVGLSFHLLKTAGKSLDIRWGARATRERDVTDPVGIGIWPKGWRPRISILGTPRVLASTIGVTLSLMIIPPLNRITKNL